MPRYAFTLPVFVAEIRDYHDNLEPLFDDVGLLIEIDAEDVVGAGEEFAKRLSRLIGARCALRKHGPLDAAIETVDLSAVPDPDTDPADVPTKVERRTVPPPAGPSAEAPLPAPDGSETESVPKDPSPPTPAAKAPTGRSRAR
jgi:hypothetical protein